MKTIFIKKRTLFFLVILWAMAPRVADAQTFSHQATVIDFLSTMSQKGYIDFDDLIKPIDRKQIFSLLQALKTNQQLNKIEKQELEFYTASFALEDSSYLPNKGMAISFRHFFKKPKDQQHVFFYKDKDFGCIVDPMVEIAEEWNSGKPNNIKASGFQVLGYAGKHIGFQMSYRDVNERGSFDSLRTDNDLPGITRKQTTDPKLLNYSQMNATISYQFRKGMITVGQDQNMYGYGQSGNLVLSNKSPAYPFYSLTYQPTKWLKYNFMHAWLQSGIIDSAASYSTGNSVYGGVREQFIPKFYAIHSIEVTAMRGLKFNIGESIVYTDKLELPYMIPITFFKAFDNEKFGDNILTGSNGQIFMGFNSRNQIRKTQLYGQLFIDEIRIGTMFDASKSRNQLGFQAGVVVADVFVPNLSITTEYTRINPFVYRNFIASQNYTNATYALGDWMGANAERLWVSAKYHPKANLILQAYMMYLDKGGAGTIEQQYFAQPQPSFGFDPQYQLLKLGFEAHYAFWNNFGLKFACSNTYQKPYQGQTTVSPQLSLGFCWDKF